jgi:putative transposase
MLELVRRPPRCGYRRIGALVPAEGWRVNRKRIHRLGRREGLHVPRKKRKKRRLGSSVHGCVRQRSLHAGHVWAWDFIHERTTDGRPRPWLPRVDAFPREGLALEGGRRLTARKAVTVLAEGVRQRGAPVPVRSDNGPEFIAPAMRSWLSAAGVATLSIEPGSPWENGSAASLGSRVRDAFRAVEAFTRLTEG